MSLIHSVILPASYQRLSHHDYEVDIYRGDLEHATAPGNKWHKLQYHLKEARARNATVIATFGGPFSNHLHAFAMTLKNLPFKAVAVVRGELQPQLTPTLRDAVECDVELWPSSRSDYRLETSSEVSSMINTRYENVYWIPEGGGGHLGALGCRDWADSIYHLNTEYDAWVVSSGTGTTAAGLLAYDKAPDLHVFSALKGAAEQEDDIIELANRLIEKNVAEIGASEMSCSKKIFFHDDCHEGGYAKQSKALKGFIQEFAIANPSSALDPVYTCKSMFAILNAIKKGSWPYSRTLFIHTGGLQGWRGYPSDSNPFISSSETQSS